MLGKYVRGSNLAHDRCNVHTPIFNCTVFGTFNVLVESTSILNYHPSISIPMKDYWFVEIKREGQSWFGWAIRDKTSKQRINVLEILTKEKLPDRLKEGDLDIVIHQKWQNEQITNWAKDKYWFQTFPFSPVKKADSLFVWNTINKKINWSGESVLDIGSHYGYFSFKASEAGARVIGVETNKSSLEMAQTIQKNIVQQDVTFQSKEPEGMFDVIMYLSVHHQKDPSYEKLLFEIKRLKLKTNKHLFVELIMPPMFPKNSKMTSDDIDKMVGGIVLTTYEHKVRGDRRIYWIAK